jgi:16S rRNA (adenine1518-N6/adenine1519-N6)-dimethyltransferase
MKSKARLGQNFLTDQGAAQRIVAALGDVSGRTVVEIGPGRGAITGGLAARAARVLAVELDRELVAGLRDRFPPDRVTVIHQDVLKFDFAACFAEVSTERAKASRLCVVGNLPYYITSPILLKLAASHAAVDSAVIMVQRELADRVLASPGSRDYGVLSVTIQMYGSLERLFDLSPESFSPSPAVHSTVFRWNLEPRFAELGVEEAAFLRFVRAAFAQKRKTLANNLRAAGIAPTLASAALAGTGLPPASRAETLSLEDFAMLWRFLASKSAWGPNRPAQHGLSSGSKPQCE